MQSHGHAQLGCIWMHVDSDQSHTVCIPYIWENTVFIQDQKKPAPENAYPDSKVHGANMGPDWGRQDPGGPHVCPMNPVIWVVL